MYTRAEEDSSEAERILAKLGRIEKALQENGISLKESNPPILGRTPIPGPPRLDVHIAKASGNWIRLLSGDKSNDDVKIVDWSVKMETKGETLYVNGWLELEGPSLVESQECWGLAGHQEDVAERIEPGDTIRVRFPSGFVVEGTVGPINHTQLSLKAERPFRHSDNLGYARRWDPSTPLYYDRTPLNVEKCPLNRKRIKVRGLFGIAYPGPITLSVKRQDGEYGGVSFMCVELTDTKKDGVELTLEPNPETTGND